VHDWVTSLEFTPDPSKTIFEQAVATARHVVDTRWQSIDPVMARNLTERLNSLPYEVHFNNNDMMLQDDPAAEIDIPAGCRREQIMTTSEYLSERIYTVRKRFLEHRKFSNLDRAGLILHELLYDMTRKNGATTSRGARYINSVIFADKQNETLMPQEHYLEVMKEAGFPESIN